MLVERGLAPRLPETPLASDSETLMESGSTEEKYNWGSAQQAMVFLKVGKEQEEPKFVSVGNKFIPTERALPGSEAIAGLSLNAFVSKITLPVDLICVYSV